MKCNGGFEALTRRRRALRAARLRARVAPTRSYLGTLGVRVAASARRRGHLWRCFVGDRLRERRWRAARSEVEIRLGPVKSDRCLVVRARRGVLIKKVTEVVAYVVVPDAVEDVRERSESNCETNSHEIYVTVVVSHRSSPTRART